MSKEEKPKMRLTAPNLQRLTAHIVGDTPLVIRRFSLKNRQKIENTMVNGPDKKKGKVREKFDAEAEFNEARYIAPAGWDGFNAASIRAAMIAACRLVNFKMTIAKLSLFVIADGFDKQEPWIALVRIHPGKPEPLKMIARVETGQPYVLVRPCYQKWEAWPLIEYDADQFSEEEVVNLLNRVGRQVGLCEGRHDSKKTDSPGMGWGTFHVQDVKLMKGGPK